MLAKNVLYRYDEDVGSPIVFILTLIVTKNIWLAIGLGAITYGVLWLFTRPAHGLKETPTPHGETRAVFTPKTDLNLKFGEVALTKDFKVNILSDSTFISSLKGFGKTSLIYSILMQVHENFDPAKVQVAILDYKEVSLRWTHNSPFLFRNTVYTNGLGVVAVNAELTRRKALYAQLPPTVVIDNVAKYNKETGSSLPIILFIVDEVQEATDDDKELLMSINKVGRSLGIILLAATQRTTSESISNAFLSQFRMRFIGYMTGRTEYKYSGLKDNKVIEQMVESKGIFAITDGVGWRVVQTDFTPTKKVEELSRSFKVKKVTLEGNDVERNTQVLRYLTTLTQKPKIKKLSTHFNITDDESRQFLKLWSRK